MNIGYYNQEYGMGPGYAGYGLAIPGMSAVTGYGGRLIDNLPLLALGALGGGAVAGLMAAKKGKSKMQRSAAAGALVGLAVAYMIKLRQERAAQAEAAAVAAAAAAQAAAAAAAATAAKEAAPAQAGWF